LNNEDDGETGLTVTLTADDGFEVDLSGFDLGNFGSALVLPGITISDGNGSVLFSQVNIDIPASTESHLDFDFSNMAANEISIHVDLTDLGGDSDNIGLDNIQFSQAAVVATPTGGIAIHPAHTGSWFDPETAGRGGFVNIAEQGEQMVFVIAWFDYNDDGTQLWLIGSSTPLSTDATSASVPVQVTHKNSNGEVVLSDWGTFTFEFSSCNNASLLIEPNTGGASQTVPLTRLTKIVGLTC
jgi:hypothetical protein